MKRTGTGPGPGISAIPREHLMQAAAETASSVNRAIAGKETTSVTTSYRYFTQDSREGFVLADLVREGMSRQKAIERAKNTTKDTGKPVDIYRIAIDQPEGLESKAVTIRIESAEELSLQAHIKRKA